jgi:hypothetical protein
MSTKHTHTLPSGSRRSLAVGAAAAALLAAASLPAASQFAPIVLV